VSAAAASGSPLSAVGEPVVNQALEPAWVRHGSASTQKAYETALAFEEMLVEQLSQSLAASSGLGGENGEEGESSEAGSSGSGAASGPLSSMLPQALTSGVMSAGGLGLAAQMTRQLASAAASGAGAAASTASGTSTTSSATEPTSNHVEAVPAAADTSPSANLAATGGTST
jgi:Rod binding domain-containing protein